MTYQLNAKLSPELESYRSAIETTIKPYIEIKLTNNPNSTWWQSKFGGMPYLPKDFDYPKNQVGEYLYLLAQINFAEVPELPGLPNRGILQFYIGANDNLYGCDFNDPTDQDNFRVIYFEEITLSQRDLVTDFNFLSQPTQYNLPFQGCCGVEFKLSYAPISLSDYKFTIFGDDDNYETLYDEYWENFKQGGHKLLGYPNFTQEDPRYCLSKKEDYILLLQIDSDRHETMEIMWGDMGIGNFFIKRTNLAKLDFSQVLYNWDCT